MSITRFAAELYRSELPIGDTLDRIYDHKDYFKRRAGIPLCALNFLVFKICDELNRGFITDAFKLVLKLCDKEYINDKIPRFNFIAYTIITRISYIVSRGLVDNKDTARLLNSGFIQFLFKIVATNYSRSGNPEDIDHKASMIMSALLLSLSHFLDKKMPLMDLESLIHSLFSTFARYCNETKKEIHTRDLSGTLSALKRIAGLGMPFLDLQKEIHIIFKRLAQANRNRDKTIDPEVLSIVLFAMSGLAQLGMPFLDLDKDIRSIFVCLNPTNWPQNKIFPYQISSILSSFSRFVMLGMGAKGLNKTIFLMFEFLVGKIVTYKQYGQVSMAAGVLLNLDDLYELNGSNSLASSKPDVYYLILQARKRVRPNITPIGFLSDTIIAEYGWEQETCLRGCFVDLYCRRTGHIIEFDLGQHHDLIMRSAFDAMRDKFIRQKGYTVHRTKDKAEFKELVIKCGFKEPSHSEEPPCVDSSVTKGVLLALMPCQSSIKEKDLKPGTKGDEKEPRHVGWGLEHSMSEKHKAKAPNIINRGVNVTYPVGHPEWAKAQHLLKA